jgi:ring-1,2-phenylacetyl-CoA epoxidase subunit PaaD
MPALNRDAVMRALEDVKDPEIPVISVVELGVIRDVAIDDRAVVVTMTPTFAGCPALHVMQAEVAERIRRLGAERVEVRLALSPPWTTDWITEEAREKLRAFGLAPPPRHGGLIQIILSQAAACPYCGSTNTSVKNTFGPTLCRAIYYCANCQQPFEQFKAL